MDTKNTQTQVDEKLIDKYFEVVKANKCVSIMSDTELENLLAAKERLVRAEKVEKGAFERDSKTKYTIASPGTPHQQRNMFAQLKCVHEVEAYLGGLNRCKKYRLILDIHKDSAI